MGRSLTVEVYDPGGTPIEGATLLAWWWFGSESLWTHTRTTDDRGLATLSGAAETEIHLEVRRYGFAPLDFGPFDLAPSTEGEPDLELVMTPAGTVTGVVTAAGAPVRDFVVRYWPITSRDRDTARFEDREDGSFTLEDVGEGSLTLVVESPTHPRCAPVTIDIRRGESTEVAIALPEAVVGRGRVVDAVTREPIPGATIQPWTNAGNQYLQVWGPPVYTAADGTFEARAFPPGDCRVVATAPGFGELYVNATTGDSEDVEFGVIGLYRGRSLTVALVPSSGTGPGGFQARASKGPVHTEWTHFDAYGTCVLQGLVPAAYEIEVLEPDGDVRVLRTSLYAGEREWRVEVGAAGTRIDVTVEPEGAPTLFDEYWVELVADDGPGEWRYRRATFVDGVATFDAVFHDRVVLELHDEEGSECAVTSVMVDADAELQRVALRVSDRQAHVRVVDRAGSAIRDASLVLSCATHAPGWTEHGSTDALGHASWAFLPCEDPVLSAYHDTHGRVLDVPVRASSGKDDVQEVVLEADGALRLRLVDDDVALTGARVWLHDSSGVLLLDSRDADT